MPTSRSVAASHAAETRKQSGAMDQFHSDDFLVYAYLQSGQEAEAKAVLDDSAAAIAHFETMSDMGDHYMTGMFPYYRTKLPIIYHLELRDWKTAAALQAVAGAPPEIADPDLLGAHRGGGPSASGAAGASRAWLTMTR